MNPSTNHLPGRVPIWRPGQEPLPPGLTEEDRPALEQTKKWEGYTSMVMESCATKTVLAGGAGAYSSLTLARALSYIPIQALALARSSRLCRPHLPMRILCYEHRRRQA